MSKMKKIKENKKIIGSAVIDLTNSKKFINPKELDYNFSPDSLFWFIMKSSDIFTFEPFINKYFKHAFRISWIYPFTLDKKTPTKEIYIIIGAYLGENYFFNKDPIREKHIWKDVEWGKRAKNYNILGKDPGTVWIKIIDDGKANTIGHEILTPEELLKRIKLSSIKNKKYTLLCISNNFKKIDEGELHHI
jgi:hypothetical protein